MERAREAAGRYVRLAATRPFNVLVAAEQLSAIGDAVTLLALPIFVYTASGSPVAAGIAVAARSLPWIFIGPAVASWTDRASRQAIMVCCDIGRAALVGSLFFVDQLPAIVAVALGSGTLSAIQRSARAALIPSLVAGDDYPTATSLQRTLLVVGTALGSAAGGVIIARIGARYGFLVDGATFAASAGLVLSARVPAGARRGAGGGGALEGWRQVFGHARLGYALLASVVASTLYGSGTLLATRAQTEVFHRDASVAGALLAVASIGVAVGSIAMGASAWLRDRYTPAAGPVAFAGAYAAMSLVPRYELALATWFLAGLVVGGHLIYLNVLTVRLLPNSVLGRAASVINALGYGGLVLGPYVTGELLAWVGPRYAPLGLALCSAAALPGAAIVSTAAARRLRRQSTEEGGDRHGRDAPPQAAEALAHEASQRERR
jgi:MFS family permease